MVKMNILLNGKPVDALAMIVHRESARSVGKEWTKKMSEYSTPLHRDAMDC